MEKKEYIYVGAGYFREKGIQKGKNAEIKHAPEYVQEILSRIEELEKQLQEKQP